MENFLQRDGLSVDILSKLSYRSQLGISLKKNLHYFDKQKLMDEIEAIGVWYDKSKILHTLALDYRIKSIQSAKMKYERYYPDHQARKVFDDLLGFRSLCDNYDDVLLLEKEPNFRIANMSHGKAMDDGYRGVHVYFQVDNAHYPIEIQYNTFFDRQLNNWLHKYLYKKDIDIKVGSLLRQKYEHGEITSEQIFKEVLTSVLCDCEA